MYRTLKAYVGNGQQNLHIRGSRLSNPYTMIDYCGKNESGCIVARQILDALNITTGYLPLEKPFKLQVCFAYKKNNSKTETMHTFMDYVHQESPASYNTQSLVLLARDFLLFSNSIIYY